MLVRKGLLVPTVTTLFTQFGSLLKCVCLYMCTLCVWDGSIFKGFVPFTCVGLGGCLCSSTVRVGLKLEQEFGV